MKNLKRVAAFVLALVVVMSCCVGAFAADVANATIDTTKTASLTVYKYDLTNAEKDGVWDSSYVSTGVYDQSVNDTLGKTVPAGADGLGQDLGNGQVSYGYAIKGVEFTYKKIATIDTYTAAEEGVNKVMVLYGMPAGTATTAFLNAIGLDNSNRYALADKVINGQTMYYFQSDTLVNALADSLEYNASTVKNALETWIDANNGTAMPETDSNGKSAVSGLELGLYLVVETAVPEMVTETTAPFLVSLPMTSIDGTNATDGGERWIYDVTIYPKNLTGFPSLEKTVREAVGDTGHNNGSVNDITDGYTHIATASAGDVVEYQVVSTLPAITSASTYLTNYTVVDNLSAGISYNKGDVVIEWFTDEACTDLIATWTERNDDYKKFNVAYADNNDGSSTMTITMTSAGLSEINTNKMVYTSATSVNSGYSDCTMRITYAGTLDSDNTLVLGDDGNPNEISLTWQRSNLAYYDTLIDDCHVYSYGIDLTKKFSDAQGDFSKVEFIVQNDSDGYFVQATESPANSGIYYVTDHVADEADATHFIPGRTDGALVIHGLEDDTYIMTEVRTDSGYSLLKDNITIVISVEDSVICEFYNGDENGVVQNDGRYVRTQKHLEHYLLTASATVDGNAVSMLNDDTSINAYVPLTVVNTVGFTLPRTGSMGNWMFPAIGLSAMMMAGIVIFFATKKKEEESEG